MGLLYKFLRVEDANSPLFGRAFSKVELRPFSREEAIEFLERAESFLTLIEIFLYLFIINQFCGEDY